MSDSQAEAADKSWEFNLREGIAPLFRHKKAAIIVFFSVLALVVLAEIFLGSNYYKAETQILVEQNRSDPTISAEANSPAASKPVTVDQVTSETELLLGSDMLRTIVQTCGLSKRWSFQNLYVSDPRQLAAMKEESATRSLAKKIKVTADTESDVITVKYASFGDPETPYCVLHNLEQLYLAKHVILSHPSGSASVFEHETSEYKKKLDEAEGKLMEFGKTENVAAPESIRSAMALEITNMQASLAQAQQSLAADNERINYLKAKMEVTPQRSKTLETSNAANLLRQNLQSALLAAQVRHSQLLTKYDPSFPLVKESEEEIKETQDQIREANSSTFMNTTTDRDPLYELLREDLSKTEADRTSTLGNLNALKQSIANTQSQMVRMDGLAIKEDALQRDAKDAQTYYSLYLSKMEQDKASSALDVQGIANVAIATHAVVPVLPAYSASLVIAVGVFFSLICAMSSAYVFEYMDPSFSTPRQVTELLGIPVLASFEKTGHA